MFTMPEAIAFGTMMLGGSGVAITGICKWRPSKTNGFMPKALCDERSQTIKDNIEEIKDTQHRIFDKIDELKK